MMRVAKILVVSLFLACVCLYAQGGGNAAITGTVVDPTGAVIPGARVTVVQTGTAITRTVTTNASGQFNVPSLPPAAYDITVTAPHFRAYKVSFTLLADQIRSISAQLQLGEAAQTVTVEGGSVMVNTVTPVLSQVIDRQRVVNLPLNGRNAADLALLVPGTVTANGHGVQQGTTKQIPGNESIAVNGARPNQISYNLDGGNNQDLMSNTNDPFPFPDALQEFSVQTNSFGVQYGANAGAVVNVVTKSGTNHWHGDAFEFLRNKHLNARNFFSPTVDPLKRNQFGGTLGGPFRKNSSFIFLGYQGTRIRSHTGGQNAFVPTPANLNGDFSAYLDANSPANPLGTVVQVVDPATGLPYPNNMIPQDQINPVAVNFSKYLPISSASPDGEVVYALPLGQDLDEGIARLDQVVRGQDTLTGRVFIDRFQNFPTFDGKSLLTDTTGSIVQSQNYLVGYTWVASPTFVNNFNAGFVRTASDRTQGGNVPQMSDFGSNLFQLPKAQGGIRGFNVNGFFSVAQFTDGKFIRNSGTIRDLSTWTHGTHTITFGGDIEHDQANVRNTDLENGSYTMNANATNLALASFMIGKLYSFAQTSGNYSDQRQNVQGLFVGDHWRATQSLTVDLGLRWDPQAPMKEIFGRVEQFNPEAAAAGMRSQVFPNAPPGLLFIGGSFNGVGVPAGGEKADLNNFAPRGGFAWDVFGNGRTVVRSGAGVFYYSRLPGLFGNDASIVPPFSLSITLTPPAGSLSNPLLGQESFEAGFPQRFILATAPHDVPFPSVTRAYSLEAGRKWVTPITYDWNFSIEELLRPDTLLRLSYVGSHGSHLREDTDMNPAVYVPGSTLSTDQRRVYPGFTDILVNRNNANSSYNAFQVDFEKRPGGTTAPILRDITLLANYTFSKAMDNLPASGGGITDFGSSLGSGRPYGDPLQGAFDTGPSDFDHTHRLVLSYVWNLPTMQSASSHLTKALLGGWNWSGIFTVTSGDALTILAGTDRSQTGLSGDRGQFIGPANLYGVGAIQPGACKAGETCVNWLNPALFTLPAVGQFGNIGKDAFRGPALWNIDTSLMKSFYPFSSRENMRFQIRADFFNIFNHARFNDPQVTVSSAGFGGIRGAADPRIIQLAAKFYF
jgi:hypothetical protein